MIETEFDLIAALQDSVPFKLNETNFAWYGRVGSEAHGTHVAPKDGGVDDHDVMAIIVPPPENVYGVRVWEGKQFSVDRGAERWDIIAYSLRKFVSLLVKQNPNVLGTLWLTGDYRSADWERLASIRRQVLSKRVYNAFAGYAHAQFEKMRRGVRQGYEGAKRREMIERFGYDPKNAAHCLRLLRMGREALRLEELHVDRTMYDAAQLIEIKHGRVGLDAILELVRAERQTMDDDLKATKLPEEPPVDLLDRKLVEMHERAWRRMR